MTNFIALIPARGGSKGLPKKNILDLHGHPLIAWSILFARVSKIFSRVLVSTDCQDIASVARSYGAEVPFLRSPELASDTSKTSDVILDIIDRLCLDTSDYVILLEPTSPYRDLGDLHELTTLVKSQGAKKIISVSECVSTSYSFQYFLGSNGEPPLVPVLNRDGYAAPRRQDVSQSYYLDGTFYASRVDAFIKTPGFLDASTLPLHVSRYSSYEIDDIFDLQIYRSIFSFIGPPAWFEKC